MAIYDYPGNPNKLKPVEPVGPLAPKPAAPTINNATMQPPAVAPVQSTLSPTQQSATDWINNPTSGQGGINTYVANQLSRYNKAFEEGDTGLLDKLGADSQRVGYALPSQNDLLRKQIEAQVNTGINAQANALNQGIAQNKNFLDEGINAINRNTAVERQGAQELQNRRGGFYSGGLDYQLGAINSSANEAIGNLQRDFNTKSSEINNKIAQLRSAAPIEIQQKLQEAIAGRAKAKAEAEQQALENEVKVGTLTGSIFGQPTIAGRTASLNETKTMADLTGYLPDGTPTNARQEQQLKELWTVAKNVGVIPDELADLYGITRGTRTQEAIKQAADISISQQNANTSAQSASTSAARESRLSSESSDSGGSKVKNVSESQFDEIFDGLQERYGVAQYKDTGKKNKDGSPIYDTEAKVTYGKPQNRDQRAKLAYEIASSGLNPDQAVRMLNKFGITEEEADELLGG